ncbi:signal recognition particle receptor subunit alpha homolog isoform X2 [Juglans microcarpa x Juglans regia]|uniref:signal recognition particle receptor subunit alpha homolog isoform X2 n=1 Tax=Juglans microcarpa x Juglans regia TaxID=2249226 RepID=UPI001B7DDC4F|nr:signal recognition particle receptor subunit alpha homolog isoform X2 [Juglans microcarpa x Juglans regia]
MQNARFEGVSNKKSESTSPNDGGDGDNTKGHNLENGHANGSYVHNEDSKVNGGVNGIGNGSSNAGAFDVNKLQKLRAKGEKKAETLVSKGSKAEPKKKITKKNRVWEDSPPQAKLDFTDDAGENGDNIEVVAADHGESMMDKEDIFSSETRLKKKKGWFSTMFQSIVGKANLEKSDLEPALKALKDRLMTKNVIAEKLCESVAASLEGKKLASFTRISSTVQTAMEEALVRILTPRRSIDILRDMHATREQRKPFVVVFVGVNGVGKSTNLAKVAYWLLQHEINVMMAACDTSRSGAVEQLRTRAQRLQIPIFEKGL